MRRLVLALLLLSACSRPPGLMTGGDFEPVSEFEGVPTGWYATRVPETTGHVSFEWDREVAHSGERSISIAIAVIVFSVIVGYWGWDIFHDSFVRGRTTGSLMNLPIWITDLAAPDALISWAPAIDLPLMGLEEIPEKIPELKDKLGPQGCWTKEAEEALLEKYV